jgi:1,4-dihydroxy-2-naphthoate octaprenyltransferase
MKTLATLRPHPLAGIDRTSARFLAGLWRLADPKISLASMAAMFLGCAAAAREGPVAWGWLALTVLGIFCIEVAKNASGEIFDFDSGADTAVAPEDRSPFSGGKRVLVDGLLTRSQTWGIAAAGYVCGAVAGIAIATLREPGVLWIGVLGMACAWFYHAPPLKLSYRGLGELAVVLAYGPLICTGTYLVQRGSVSREVLLLSIPLGLLIAAFLVINEFPDVRADLAAGKRNLVVRLGRKRASLLFAGLNAVAAVSIVILPLAGVPSAARLGLFAVIPAALATRILRDNRENTARLVPAQRLSLAAFLTLAAAAGAGLWIG